MKKQCGYIFSGIASLVPFSKSIAVQEKEFRSDFQTVPDGLTLAEPAGVLANKFSRRRIDNALRKTCVQSSCESKNEEGPNISAFTPQAGKFTSQQG